MTFSLNDKQLLKISFVLALDNPGPKRTHFFVFMKRGYFQIIFFFEAIFLLLSE